MRKRELQVRISSSDYWFKIVKFLQQNWALIDQCTNSKKCTIYFIGDTSGVFDQMSFPSIEKAENALVRNGFRRFSEDSEAQKFLSAPSPPFYESKHPNGPIYSSGRFWQA